MYALLVRTVLNTEPALFDGVKVPSAIHVRTFDYEAYKVPPHLRCRAFATLLVLKLNVYGNDAEAVVYRL